MVLKNKLFCAQLATHASVVPMLIWASGTQWIVSLIVYFFTGCVGMAMTYHRLLSHRSWKAPAWLETFGAVCGVLGLTGTTLAWCAVHREHHRFTDEPGDPHSPHFQSVFKVQFLSMFFRPNLRYVKDLLVQPTHRFLHRHYWKINFTYAALLFAFDPFAVVYAYLFPAFFLWNAGSAVNTLGHLTGYKNYLSRDQAKNNWVLGLISWGEGWHNNHHRYQKNPYFGHRWFELDTAGFLIRLLRRRSAR